jgi:hypothetical protein
MYLPTCVNFGTFKKNSCLVTSWLAPISVGGASDSELFRVGNFRFIFFKLGFQNTHKVTPDLCKTVAMFGVRQLKYLLPFFTGDGKIAILFLNNRHR